MPPSPADRRSVRGLWTTADVRDRPRVGSVQDGMRSSREANRYRRTPQYRADQTWSVGRPAGDPLPESRSGSMHSMAADDPVRRTTFGMRELWGPGSSGDSGSG